MADQAKAELQKIKRNRGTITGNVTKAYNKLQCLAHASLNTYDLETLEKTRASIDIAETQYEETRQDVEYTWLDVEEDPHKLEAYEYAEDEAYAVFTNHVGATRTFVNRLIVLKAATQAATHLQDDIEDLRRAKDDQPERDHSKLLAMLTESFEK